jgi:hypothetical protein
MASMIYFLAVNPDCEAAVVAEVDAYGRGRKIEIGDLGSFPYLHVSGLLGSLFRTARGRRAAGAVGGCAWWRSQRRCSDNRHPP